MTQEGAWEKWLIYFLRGVRLQADDAIDRMEEIDSLFEDWREELADVQSGQPERVLRLFVENPYWTVGGIAKELDVAYTTDRRAIDRLEMAGGVSPIGAARRNRVYCAREMLDILVAPAPLAALARRAMDPELVALPFGSTNRSGASRNGEFSPVNVEPAAVLVAIIMS